MECFIVMNNFSYPTYYEMQACQTSNFFVVNLNNDEEETECINGDSCPFCSKIEQLCIHIQDDIRICQDYLNNHHLDVKDEYITQMM